MADKPYYQESEGAQLRSWALGQMMRGAGYAALFLFTIGLCFYALYGISLLLPEESKQAPAPNLGALEQPVNRTFA